MSNLRDWVITQEQSTDYTDSNRIDEIIDQYHHQATPWNSTALCSNNYLFAKDLQGRLLGFLLFEQPKFNLYAQAGGRSVVVITDLYVDRERASEGIATTLLNEFYVRYRSKFHIVLVSSYDTRLFSKHGFIPTQVLQETELLYKRL